MEKRQFASSQPDAQPQPKDASIIKHNFDPEKPLSDESRKRLIALSQEPDDKIRTDLIPELTPEAWQHARKNPYLALVKTGLPTEAS